MFWSTGSGRSMQLDSVLFIEQTVVFVLSSFLAYCTSSIQTCRNYLTTKNNNTLGQVYYLNLTNPCLSCSIRTINHSTFIIPVYHHHHGNQSPKEVLHVRHTPHPLNLELPPGKKFLVDESCVQRWRATMTEAEDLGLQEILERKNERRVHKHKSILS